MIAAPVHCWHVSGTDACYAPQPSLSDEQRVLTLLSEQLAAERAAAKEREAAELALRMQETLVNVLPPLRTPEVIEREQARIKEEERRRQEEELSISCAVQ